ncbi:MAG: 50S ribosomal protein L27 [uncultured bacterium]|uniref:Large ribosomal subunit protein bL27 n=1 Tax=Candidatus Curtissbacteria bacterium RIFOXYA1_FULL_41_14 TaxID=1797737 RepID=A0A1F5HAH8_9BACT|nr:MAG: 50S ribosomal protein L27 [uncultured bacterium]KKR56597.1 MAG: 50S ribosomal protein L27 [Candidatus Curtissbacteria bacterium GW2011_GWB1_40_28]KKR60742.1 MAG: 50S ribosomal protein L27 [Candidatus Curtissbacteria bacterium GW2011_GWA2_40_31]KKR61631.1 MAG: 50S ribosomal protein L27 [Microgenomates group bacterium GW2011_GWC1_40_35]KKR65018.1 MAG: 50S ribosomal protein L27 [Candidatus Curtissbacteria bacterium GW2011_GWA1_40_47]KKR77822.1 MAG: 50S ribosomal protein L27 [Candidatus Cu
MAHKKGGGATAKNRDSAGKRLGVKIYGGQKAEPGNIVIRQRGTVFYSGQGTMLGRDHTVFAVASGTVKFIRRLGKKFVQVT